MIKCECQACREVATPAHHLAIAELFGLATVSRPKSAPPTSDAHSEGSAYAAVDGCR